MEAALRIDNGHNEVVYMKDIKERGELKIKSYTYQCPDYRCQIAMIVVFPKNEGKSGKETHVPHFRAKPKHIKECRREVPKKSGNPNSLPDKGNKPYHEELRQMSYPVEFTEVESIKIAPNWENPEEDFIEDYVGEGTKKNSKGGHESKHKTKHLKSLVEAFEENKDSLDKMAIKIEGCPARNYANAFVNLEHRKEQDLTKMGRYVFYGEYISHRILTTGTSILFGLKFIGNKMVGVWVENKLEPNFLLKAIRSELETASEKNAKATVYALGKFINHAGWKYSIELETANLIWISNHISPSRDQE